MKVAVLGYGIEGKSAEQYFLRHGEEVEVFDGFKEGDIVGFGLDEFDLVMRSPSVRPQGEWSSVTKYFFEKCPCKIVGVTGTKGKGTTCSLIASILSAAYSAPTTASADALLTRRMPNTAHSATPASLYSAHSKRPSRNSRVWLVGNIGVPALDVLDEIEAEDVVVYELSSFQLWDMRRSPQVAVVGHIEPDHLDVHRDFTEYVGAKANITKWQSEKDVVVYDRGNVEAVKIAEASRGEKIGFPTGEYEGVLDSLRLVGRHNRLNGEAAIIAARCLGVEDVEAWKRGLASFTGLPHRTKFVREVGGVSYYDNSIATVPGSTITDIRAFSEPKVLILGGSTKGAEFYELAKVVSHGGVRGVVLMGPEGEKVGEALRAAGFSEIVNVGREYDMKEVVRAATEMAQAGDVVILSPAAASFDRFKSYAERGDKFIQAVEEL